MTVFRFSRHQTLLLALLGVILLPAVCGGAEKAVSVLERPNILWITAEDLSPVLGCYGDGYAITPNLDRLAQQGVRYTHAFAMASVCTPARSCLITGIYSSSLGTQHLRGEQPLPKDVRCFTEYLRDVGYYCTNNVKEDYNFATPKAAWDESSDTAHWRKRKPGQPFFSVFNFMTTHQSRVRFPKGQYEKITSRLTPQERHDPSEAPLPPYYPDTPLVRHDVAQLHDLVTAMDKQTQDLLDQLEEDGVADNTIVFFYSDHGTGMPRHKRWLYDSGTRVPLIIRFPKTYQHLSSGKPGTTTDRLVSFVDFAPTVLSLVDLKIPEYMQGTAFLGEQAGEARKYVFAIRDRVDEVYEMSRAVRDHRYLFIRNYIPHRPRMQHSDFSERTPTRKELRRLTAEGKLTGAVQDFMSPTKACEELYDTVNDPHQIHNLMDSVHLVENRHNLRTMQRLREELFYWMIRTRDTGLIPEVEMRKRSAGGSPYDMAREKGKFDVRKAIGAAEKIFGSNRTTVEAELPSFLGDSDAAVRYWAVMGLAARGSGAARPYRPATGSAASEVAQWQDALTKALSDEAPNVRFAAAEALCSIGKPSQAAPVLATGLHDDDPVVRLYAAMTLVAVGEAAQSATVEMQKALQREPAKGTYPLYIRWALAFALKRLGN